MVFIQTSIMTRNIHWIFSFLFCLFVYVLEAWNNCTVQEILLLYVPGVLVNLVLLDWILKMSGPFRFFELDLRVENKTNRAILSFSFQVFWFLHYFSKFYAEEASSVVVLPENYFLVFILVTKCQIWFIYCQYYLFIERTV